MTPAEARTKINNWLTARWPTVVARQDAHFALYGRYFQGLITHTALPADGEDALPDLLNRAPHYQTETWLVFNALTALPIPCAVTIDAYHGPQGQGWVATVRGRLNGITWERSQNVGPETWRTESWHQVPGG